MTAFAQALLVMIFGFAGLAKLARRDEFARNLAALPWLPEKRRASIARLVPVVELALAGLLVASPRAGAVATVAVLTAFTAVLIREIAAKRTFNCGCLGDSGSEPAGPYALLRNAAMIAAALALAAPSYSFSLPAALTGIGVACCAVLFERTHAALRVERLP